MKRNEKLKNLRRALGYTQTGFAELLGVPRTQITMYETGERQPSVNFLLTLKEKCNVSYEWLGEWACELAQQKRNVSTED
jgi:transcriptional regulator with XRE-family HTH domain